jgi:hypothetical protein
VKGFSETGNTGNAGKFVAIHFLLTRRDGIGALILADDSRSWRDNLLVAKFDSTLSTGGHSLRWSWWQLAHAWNVRP